MNERTYRCYRKSIQTLKNLLIKVSIWPTGFLWCWYLCNVKNGILKEKKIGLRHFNALRSSFKIPVSTTPNEVHRESMQKKSLAFWMGRDVMSGSPKYPSSSVVARVLSSTRNKQTEFDEAMQSSRKQNKNKVLRCSWSDFIRHQSFIAQSTSLRVRKT